MKKRLSILLSLIMTLLLLFASCDLPALSVQSEVAETQPVTVGETVSLAGKQGYKAVTLKNGYKTLDTASQRRCYESIKAHVDDFSLQKQDSMYLIKPFTVLDCKITKNELAKVFTAFFEDNPYIFWLDETYAFSITNNSVELHMYSIMSQEEYTAKTKKLDAVIKKILKPLKKNMSAIDVERYLHDYIIKNCTYKKDIQSNTINSAPFNIYGALVNKSAVCKGYTKAFQYLLSQVGINSCLVSGSSENVEHIWNGVSLDGEWYYTDVTWDDTDMVSRYDYFNITTSQLMKKHKINKLYKDCTTDEIVGTDSKAPINFNLYVPKCKGKRYNYYRYYGSVMEYIDNNTLAQDLATAANKRKKYFHIYVDTKMLNYTMTYDQLFSYEVYGFAEYIRKANTMTPNKLKTSISVIKKQKLDTITVKLSYE